MPTGEQAGAVYVSIDADAGPLIEKFSQAQAQAKAAGQQISSALASGLNSGVSPILTAAGKTQAAVTQIGTAATQAAPRIAQIGTAAAQAAPPVQVLATQVTAAVTAATVATPVIQATAVATANLGNTAAAASQKAQSFVGVIPGLGRAAEHFINLLPGVGSAIMAAFPILGALALTQNLISIGGAALHAAGSMGELTEEEKKNAEQTRKTADEWENLVKKFESGEIERATLEISHLAGLKLGSFFDESEAQRMRARLQSLTTELGNVRKAQAVDVATSKPSSNPLIAGAEALNPAVTVTRLMANVDWKGQQEKIKPLEDEIGILTEKLHTYDTVSKRVNADKLGKQIADDSEKAAREAARIAREQATEEKRIASEAERQNRVVIEGVTIAKRAAAAESKKIHQEINADLTQSLREGTSETSREVDEQRRVFQVMTADRLRAGNEGIRASGVQQQSDDEVAKLQLQQQYSLQIVHNRQDELTYATQIAAADEKALSDRVAELEELKLYQTLTGQVREATATDLQIQQAKSALLKQQVQDQTKMASLTAQQSLAVQIQSQVGKGPGSLVDARNVVLANAMGTAVDGIAASLGRAVQGGQKLGQIFSQLGRSILGQVVQGIAKIGLQMVTTALLGKAAGSAIAVAQVTSAAAVGAANAAAATAAIPIIGPSLAPAAAAATFAEIMAFAPLASYDKGGMIGEDQIARIHKGEYILTADQVSGKSALPNIPSSGLGIGSNPLTSSMSVSNASQAMTIGAIHLHGVRDLRDVAKRLPALLKAVAPNFSPATR